MSTLTTYDHLSLAVSSYGSPDAPLTVVLGHCWTSDQDDWRYQVRDLLQEFGHRIQILTWDHRGHGQSDQARRPACTIENLARDEYDLIQRFAPEGALVLAGHSIGGMTIMALAEQYPELFDRVVGVLLTNTSAGDLDTVTLGMPDLGPAIKSQIPRLLAFRAKTLSRRARRRAPILERFVMRNLVFGRTARSRDRAIAVDGLINSSPATMMGFYEDMMLHQRADSLRVLDGIATRVYAGGADKLTPAEHAQLIADRIGSADLTVCPGAGHMLPFERDDVITRGLVDLVSQGLEAR